LFIGVPIYLAVSLFLGCYLCTLKSTDPKEYYDRHHRNIQRSTYKILQGIEISILDKTPVYELLADATVMVGLGIEFALKLSNQSVSCSKGNGTMALIDCR
jgi:hypothetical protein